MADQEIPYIIVKAGEWLRCVDPRQSGGHLVEGEHYFVTEMHGATNVWIENAAGETVGPHFWHVVRFEKAEAPKPTEEGPKNCRECGAKATVSPSGMCPYCVRRLSARPEP